MWSPERQSCIFLRSPVYRNMVGNGFFGRDHVEVVYLVYVGVHSPEEPAALHLGLLLLNRKEVAHDLLMWLECAKGHSGEPIEKESARLEHDKKSSYNT